MKNTFDGEDIESYTKEKDTLIKDGSATKLLYDLDKPLRFESRSGVLNDKVRFV